MITTSKNPGKDELLMARRLSSFLSLPYVRRGRKGLLRLNELANSLFQEYIGIVEKGKVLTLFRAGLKEPTYLASLKIISFFSRSFKALDPIALENPTLKKSTCSLMLFKGRAKKGELRYEPLH